MAAADAGTGRPRDDERARRLGALVLNSAKWVHRRVDTVTFNPDGSLHHRISFDLTVPAGLAVPGSAGRVLVPLALMEKGQVRTGCSAENPVGGQMPVLEAGECARLAVGMLHDLLSPAGEAGHVDGLPEGLLERIVRLPGDASQEAKEAALGEWDAWLENTSADLGGQDEGAGPVGRIDELVRALVGSELLIAELEASYMGTRCVLKVSYDTDLRLSRGPGPARTVRFRVPGFGFAASQHIQADAPACVAMRELSATVTHLGRILASEHDAPGGGMAHVAVRSSQLTAEADIVVRVGAAPGRTRSTVVGAVVGVVGLATASVLERTHLIHVLASPLSVPSLSLTLLFGALTLDLLWNARTPEHRFVARVQAPLRWMLRLCAVVLLVACLLVTLPVPNWAWETAWDVVAVAAGAAGLSFAVYASAGEDRPRWTSGLGRSARPSTR